MKRPDPASSYCRHLSLGLGLLALAACSGSGGDATVGTSKPSGDFVVLRTSPVNGATVYLNDPIQIDFSGEVDIDSATLSTLTFQALDQSGNPVSEQVTGTFSVETSPGDATPGRRLQFVPQFAKNNTYTDGGFRAGRTYLCQLVGGNANNNTVIRDTLGRALEQPLTFQFSTREGTQPGQLFRNPMAGGPKRTAMSVSTATDLDEVPLGLFGGPPIEVRLDFDQALNPNDVNVPVNFDPNPLLRDINDRGRVWLEYLDPEYSTVNPQTPYTWIPASVELERNDLTGATLVLRPVGVLPNNAEIRVIVQSTVEDISGENNIANPTFNEVFGTFRTSDAYEQQWNGVYEDFRDINNIALDASFAESQAEVGQGFVKAGFAFEGSSTSLEYEPTANEVVLNTSFTQIVPKAGLPFTVSGGVFNFRNVTIPQGVTVRGTGPNPMVWLCSGKFEVSGTLTVSGGNGARVDTLNSANFAKAGGVGVCGGGNGGDGTPSATLRDLRGGTGRGPLQEAGTGGRGGFLCCDAQCYTGSGYNSSGGGSGGGGGTMATQGDLNWRGTIPQTTNPNESGTPNNSPATAFQQVRGFGGAGCSGNSTTRTRFLAGGDPGDLVFTDSRRDNDFWGSAIDLSRNLRITGELTVPIGGGGGGGGGDTSPTDDCTLTGNDPKNDYSGGGGGGGGGVLIVKALEEIRITQTGKVEADGGNGGGGEQVGACGEAGGGGAGAGGMVILMSAKEIIIEAHGDPSVGTEGRYVYGRPDPPNPTTHPFQDRDYDFAISADGGVCTTGGFGSINVQGKYRANGTTMINGTDYDREPLGGLGGMGIVQLMVPPGENLFDGTNTRLDDNIRFQKVGPTGPVDLDGAFKQQLIAWRGFPNEFGIPVDDMGNPTLIGNNEGDIRPAPMLMPVPFNSRSRIRSKWIDTGASQRRELGAPDGMPRGLVTANGEVAGPVYEFGGLQNDHQIRGYVRFGTVGNSIFIDYPDAVLSAGIDSIDTDSSYLGEPAYRIKLATAALPETNRYVQYEAELRNSLGSRIASYRIVGHSLDELIVEPVAGLMPEQAVSVDIVPKFFQIETNGSEGLGPTYRAEVVPSTGLPGPPVPIANVRIGFAFHQDPQSTDPDDRFPTGEQDFVYDLRLEDGAGNPTAFGDYVMQRGNPRFVRWDVLFDMQYNPSELPGTPPALNPSSPRPELRFLRLPFRF